MTKSLTFTPIVLSQKKMKRIPSESSLATLNDSEQLKFDRNRKISESVKLDFIEMVTQRNFSMKNAAKMVGISYSTAKKIFTFFRSTLKTSSVSRPSEQTVDTNLPRASFIQKDQENRKTIQICCLIGGVNQNE